MSMFLERNTLWVVDLWVATMPMLLVFLVNDEWLGHKHPWYAN